MSHKSWSTLLALLGKSTQLLGLARLPSVFRPHHSHRISCFASVKITPSSTIVSKPFRSVFTLTIWLLRNVWSTYMPTAVADYRHLIIAERSWGKDIVFVPLIFQAVELAKESIVLLVSNSQKISRLWFSIWSTEVSSR